MSSNPAEVPFDPNEVSDEYKDRFIRGVMAAQIWAYVVGEEPEDFVGNMDDDGPISEEWDKAMNGEEHELGMAVANEYALPVNYYGGRAVLPKKYQRRYRRAFKKLGIEPSMKEKIVNGVFFAIMGQE